MALALQHIIVYTVRAIHRYVLHISTKIVKKKAFEQFWSLYMHKLGDKDRNVRDSKPFELQPVRMSHRGRPEYNEREVDQHMINDASYD